MPFTLFKFPTLFGKKQSSYKLDRSVSLLKHLDVYHVEPPGLQELVPMQLDLDGQAPVILSHTKPSFTTFGYNR